MLSLLSGTSWSCPSPSPTLTPPFPLPPTDSEDPVEALLQLAAAANSRAQCSLASSGSASQGPSSGQAQVNPVTGEQESDEGIVSDQSNEFEDKKVGGTTFTFIIDVHLVSRAIVNKVSCLDKRHFFTLLMAKIINHQSCLIEGSLPAEPAGSLALGCSLPRSLGIV